MIDKNTIHLYLAPAGYGKTAYVLERIRQAHTLNPLAQTLVILPNQAQVKAFRHRLSQGQGSLGVSLGTFYNLYPEILNWAGKPEPCLPEAVQIRLLQTIVTRLTEDGQLPYYAPLCDKPGFVVVLRTLLEELKRANIRREAFRQAVEQISRQEQKPGFYKKTRFLQPDTRLTELAYMYHAYQEWLLDYNWADTEGQGWLAALALERDPDLSRNLPLLIVDGFDEFNPTQLAVLKLLAERADETIITLTGTVQDMSRPPLRRFTRALEAVREALEKAGGRKAEAAEMLGLSRTTFWRKMKKYGVG